VEDGDRTQTKSWQLPPFRPLKNGLRKDANLFVDSSLCESLTEPLQVAKDNGAKRALIPIENKRNLLDVSADIMEHVDPVFYGVPKTAAMKVLGNLNGRIAAVSADWVVSSCKATAVLHFYPNSDQAALLIKPITPCFAA
jgi:hypothetical protein